MYRKKLEALTENDRRSIEQDIMHQNVSAKELADRYGYFEDVIQAIKRDMGMVDDIKEYNMPSTPKVNTVVIDVSKLKKTATPIPTRKISKGSRISEDLKLIVVEKLNEYYKKGWKGFNRDKFLKKYSISNSSLVRICDAYDIHLPRKNAKTVIPVTIDSEMGNKDLEPLNTYIASNVISCRIDESINIKGVNFAIYSVDLSRPSNALDDYDTPIANFFRKNIVNKNVSLLKIFVKPKTLLDPMIYVSLTKYCSANNCNLTIIDGIVEKQLITDYTKLNKNFQKFSTCALDTTKYLYKTKFSSAKNTETLFTVSVIYNTKKELIIVDTYTKALEYVMYLESQRDTDQDFQYHKLFVNKITDGNDTMLLYLEAKV